MSLKVYNTLSRRKEEFQPLEEGQVRMYVCGPTVYDRSHVGHAMSYVIFDAIRRYLEYLGYEVRHVQNFTDVEDKIIARARVLGVTPEELADKHSREFLDEMDTLNVKRADVYPRATAEVPKIIEIVQDLVEKGYAYPADGSVYFRVERLPDYGKLSRRSLAEMGTDDVEEAVNGKEHPMDFALWKAAKPGEPAWHSPWGEGRPGWHIECSAMCMQHLAEQVDIHGGGLDLVFPHHENEIAQSEAHTGQKPFAKYWLHNGLMRLGEEKMSKSLGNFIAIQEFLQEYEPEVLRLFVLSSHYRRPVTYTDESIEAARRGLERLRSGLRPPREGADAGSGPLTEQVAETREGFIAAMNDDFNTAQALAQLFDLVKAINQARDAGVAGEPFAEAQATLQKLAGVLGFKLESPADEELAPAPFIQLLIDVRARLRDDERWDLADQIRADLAELGVQLEDGPQGTTWRMN